MTTPKLIVLRGNAGSGKTTVARLVQHHHGPGLVVVGQDAVRSMISSRVGVPNGGLTGPLIDTIARHMLNQGQHVIIEGILTNQNHGPTLRRLALDHTGPTHAFYMQVDLDETIRRHEGRTKANQFGPEEMRSWWRNNDVLHLPNETVIPGTTTAQDAAQIILDTILEPAPTT